MNILLFSIGAALGAPIRFWIDNKFRPQYRFPIGIFIANILGAFLIGIFAKHMNYFIVGFCGALTTWSTYIVDVFLELQNRAYFRSLFNLVGSLLFGVLAFKFGNSLYSA